FCGCALDVRARAELLLNPPDNITNPAVNRYPLPPLGCPHLDATRATEYFPVDDCEASFRRASSVGPTRPASNFLAFMTNNVLVLGVPLTFVVKPVPQGDPVIRRVFFIFNIDDISIPTAFVNNLVFGIFIEMKINVRRFGDGDVHKWLRR